MTDDHPSTDEGQAGAEPTTQQPESTKDAPTVPLGEHIDLRKELRAVRDELAALKGSRETPQQESKQPANTPASDDNLREVVQNIQRRERVRDIQAELGLNVKQTEAVMEILDGNPSLNTVEAKIIASARNAELFAAESRPDGFDAGTHGVMRPRSAHQHPEPKVSDFKQRQAHIAKMAKHNRVDAQTAFNNWVGSFAAKAAGKEHSLMPLPRQDQ